MSTTDHELLRLLKLLTSELEKPENLEVKLAYNDFVLSQKETNQKLLDLASLVETNSSYSSLKYLFDCLGKHKAHNQ